MGMALITARLGHAWPADTPDGLFAALLSSLG